ncbi:MAG: hypothetical protein RR795_01530 [Cetobacterium sp.]|uniref:hypothetical protein n=1 Tax=Cetobacterium sp. TaxID=2071632 RepID=UPI002FC858A6
MKKIDILGKDSSTIILDLNDFIISNVLVRSDLSIIDAIKIAEETVKEFIKGIEGDYVSVFNYDITRINKGYKYLVIDKSEKSDHVFRDEKTDDTDGISELVWIVDINVEEVYAETKKEEENKLKN